jgi:hypothetical protein
MILSCIKSEEMEWSQDKALNLALSAETLGELKNEVQRAGTEI